MAKYEQRPVQIVITGTAHDARLISRALKLFLPVANDKEQEDISAYLSLIEYAVRKAKGRLVNV